MKTLLRWIINAGALLLIAYLIPGISVTSFYIALIVALIIGLINITLKPIVIFFTLPINILTLGLFTFVINALLFWFVSSFVQGFVVAGFGVAFLGAFSYSILSWLINSYFKK